MKTKSVYIIFIILSASLSEVRSQASDYTLLRHLTTKDGLPSNNIYSIIEDREGFIWAATDKGVVKFVGENIRVFTTADGLPKNDVFDLKEDQWGRIWVMNIAESIVYFKNDTIHQLNEEEGAFYFRDFGEDSIGINFNMKDYDQAFEKDGVFYAFDEARERTYIDLRTKPYADTIHFDLYNPCKLIFLSCS